MKKILLAVVLLFVSGTAQALAPVSPSSDLSSKIKTTTNQIPDLPYKPKDPDDLEVTDESADDATLTDETEKPKETIDWASLPFVPFKRADLSPAPDPEF
jgi:hypothetical protein